MPVYISLLRGINVSGQKKILMADLKIMFQDLGFQDVVTYIQSGNVIFKTRKTKEAKLEIAIKAAIDKKFGFDVPVLVLMRKELQELADNNPYKDRDVELKFLLFTILATAPDHEKLNLVQKIEFPGEEFTATQRVVYLCIPNGYGKSKLSNNFFEAKLKVKATTRNLKSIYKLLELSTN